MSPTFRLLHKKESQERVADKAQKLEDRHDGLYERLSDPERYATAEYFAGKSRFFLEDYKAILEQMAIDEV